MILYFADRQLSIIGQASTKLPKGLTVVDDNKTEEVETGVSVFECKIPFTKDTRSEAEEITELGNHIIMKDGDEDKLYTIIEAEIDTLNQEVYIYAEDDGMDLLNEVVGAYEADKAYNIDHYINMYAADAGFVIGINEVADLTRKLSWDGESTATARIASVATQFDGCEISFSFEIDGLNVAKKYINIYKERGKDVGVTLRLNQDIDRIITTKSIANLATALQCTGGTPDDDNLDDDIDPVPITLKGYSYDDGDFYVDSDGLLKSRKALEKWSRFLWKTDESAMSGGHIVKQYSYDTVSQQTLCAHAITELKKICDMEVNYEADISKFPDSVKVGDRINIVDDAGELYLSTRVLKLEASETNQERKVTFGEHLIKTSGISEKVIELAEQFAATAAANRQARLEAMKAAQQAEAEAEAARLAAEKAEQEATQAEADLVAAQQAAEAAEQAAAQAKADAADANAQVTIAQNAATQATTVAEEAKTTAEDAQTKAESAVADATDAKTTALAAKIDAEKAIEDVNSLADELETVSTTMEADYARKTELTEATASLDSKISQNAAQISTNVSKLVTVDETANDAKEKAEAAQSAADGAQTTADDAQAAVDTLGIRVTDAETSIVQNAEAIELRAVKTEVDQSIAESEALLELLSNCITMLVRDENGESLMTHDGNSWSFSMKETSDAISGLSSLVDTLQSETDSTQATVEELQKSISGHDKTLEYVRITTYEDEPCIELGESDSDFKLLITNTRIMFMNGTNVPTYINTNGLVTKNIEVTGNIVQGKFAMMNTADGGWGLLWIGGST